MCFNAALVQSIEIIEEAYGASFPADRFDTPAYFMSAFAHPSWPVLKQGNRESFLPSSWGLVPSWIRDAGSARSIRDKTINARFETLDSKPSFRNLVNSHRCGVLVDGFVEWREFKGNKYPYHIALPGKTPFMLAGLWDRWKDPGSDTSLESFTVVTVDAKGLPAQIHNRKLRMPFILGKNSGEAWMDPKLDFSACRPLMKPVYRSLEAWPVSREVSRPGAAKNNPDIQVFEVYPDLPELQSL